MIKPFQATVVFLISITPLLAAESTRDTDREPVTVIKNKRISEANDAGRTETRSKGPPAAPENKNFRAREKLSADIAVSFPADI